MGQRKNSVFSLVLFAALTAGATMAVIQPSTARADDKAEDDGPGPCNAKKFHYPAVEKACKDGGKKAAKALMKTALDKAKKAGKTDWKCKSCHTDLSKYDLTKNAVEDLKPYI
jgi:hypothetical protein